MRRILLLFLFCIYLFCTISTVYSKENHVQKGTVDYNGEAKLSLEGEWQFCWDTLLYDNTTIEKEKFLNIPAYWQDHDLNTLGKATYFLEVFSDKEYPMRGLIVPEVQSAYHLYVNGKLLSQNGIVHSDSARCVSKWIPKTILVSLRKGKNVFCLQMANYTHSRGGTYKPLELGDVVTIFNKRELQVAIDVFLIGSLTTIGVFFLGLFIFWRKDKSVLFYALSCLSYALRTSVYDLHLLNKVFWFAPWEVMTGIEYISTYATFLFWASLLKSLYPEDFHKRVYQFFAIFFTGCIVLILFTKPLIYSYYMKVGLVVMILLSVYSLYVLVRAFYYKRTGAIFTITSLGMLLLVPAFSLAFYFKLIPYIPYFENFSSLWVNLSVSFLMALRFALAFKKVEELKEQKFEQNKVISEALKEKELLVSEIHHRVKNNLQIVNSLLMLQSKTIVDHESVKAFEESQFRIQTMALVHQKLYQDSHNLGVDMGEYLLDLGNMILDSYPVEPEINFKLKLDKLYFDIDTVIPIGLITNELMTNSIKYAFMNVAQPEISIEMEVRDNMLLYLYKDNGGGFDYNSLKTKSFGLKLIGLLSKKLKCTPVYELQKDGMQVRFEMGKFKRMKHE